MRYEIVLTNTAKEHYFSLPARWRAMVKEGLETYLRHEPMKLSRSRIKRLRGVKYPEYRLRLYEYRVFYNLAGQRVVVLAIVPKSHSSDWLKQYGEK